MAPLRKSRKAGNGGGNRRAHGALEAEILAILWDAGEPLSPAQVRESLARRHPSASGEETPRDLAYTTVVTILTRLFEKNVLSRKRDGRAFRYAPVTDEAGLAARRLAGVLDAVPDRQAVLSRFIEDLSDRDEQLLRSVLQSRPEPPVTGTGTDAGGG